MSDCKYVWWPISFRWDSGPLRKTLRQQIRYALESYKWTMDNPHKYSDPEALRVHQKAARRFWHGWPVRGSFVRYGRTIHIGRFKILFGRP